MAIFRMVASRWERARSLLFGSRRLLFGSRRRGLVTAGAAAIAAAAVGLPALAAGPGGSPAASELSLSVAPSAYASVSASASGAASASTSASTSASGAAGVGSAASAAASAAAAAAAKKAAAARAAAAAAAKKAAATAIASTKAATVLREVAKLKGSPYVFGATGPRTFDCSGLTQFVYAKIGVKLVNYVPTQLDKAKVVPHSKQRPGDLIFFLSGDFAYHVGIYAGNHKMWDAPTEGQTVGLHEIWDDSYVVGQFY
ncbi:NlpC/P60 family protein [Hamadaea sp. NPDC051192]|uniref:C40 family peptidase n=1 Tax=Hamadaea sp. NPDC051192 TaxID=3154940 RepID=UPI003443AE3F